MAHYYVSKYAQPNGEYEVHKSGCPYAPLPVSYIHLGDFQDCEQAMDAAKKYHSKLNGCKHCAEKCHASSGNDPSRIKMRPT